jgi:hypothetical protein
VAIYFYQITENQIHRALELFGAKHSGLRCDHTEEKYRRHLNQKEKKKQSNLIKDATRMYIIGAVLIATVAFGATFAIPGGYKEDDHLNGGTPTLAGRYIFDAFMMANTLAFVCSTAATTTRNHLICDDLNLSRNAGKPSQKTCYDGFT